MPLSKSQIALLVGAGTACACAVGTALYVKRSGALKRIQSYFYPIDEGFAETSMMYEPPELKILVLGLQGAGKTAILRHLTASASDAIEEDAAVVNHSNSGDRVRTFSKDYSHEQGDSLAPTEGFKVVKLTWEGQTYNVWEIGGNENTRKFLNHFYEDTHLLVFMIDSADKQHQTDAYAELRTVLADPRLADVPLLLVATKQDLPDCLSAAQILRESECTNIGKRRIECAECSYMEIESREKLYAKMFNLAL